MIKCKSFKCVRDDIDKQINALLESENVIGVEHFSQFQSSNSRNVICTMFYKVAETKKPRAKKVIENKEG